MWLYRPNVLFYTDIVLLSGQFFETFTDNQSDKLSNHTDNSCCLLVDLLFASCTYEEVSYSLQISATKTETIEVEKGFPYLAF